MSICKDGPYRYYGFGAKGYCVNECDLKSWYSVYAEASLGAGLHCYWAVTADIKIARKKAKLFCDETKRPYHVYKVKPLEQPEMQENTGWSKPVDFEIMSLDFVEIP